MQGSFSVALRQSLYGGSQPGDFSPDQSLGGCEVLEMGGSNELDPENSELAAEVLMTASAMSGVGGAAAAVVPAGGSVGGGQLLSPSRISAPPSRFARERPPSAISRMNACGTDLPLTAVTQGLNGSCEGGSNMPPPPWSPSGDHPSGEERISDGDINHLAPPLEAAAVAGGVLAMGAAAAGAGRRKPEGEVEEDDALRRRVAAIVSMLKKDGQEATGGAGPSLARSRGISSNGGALEREVAQAAPLPPANVWQKLVRLGSPRRRNSGLADSPAAPVDDLEAQNAGRLQLSNCGAEPTSSLSAPAAAAAASGGFMMWSGAGGPTLPPRRQKQQSNSGGGASDSSPGGDPPYRYSASGSPAPLLAPPPVAAAGAVAARGPVAGGWGAAASPLRRSAENATESLEDGGPSGIKTLPSTTVRAEPSSQSVGDGVWATQRSSAPPPRGLAMAALPSCQSNAGAPAGAPGAPGAPGAAAAVGGAWAQRPKTSAAPSMSQRQQQGDHRPKTAAAQPASLGDRVVGVDDAEWEDEAPVVRQSSPGWFSSPSEVAAAGGGAAAVSGAAGAAALKGRGGGEEDDALRRRTAAIVAMLKEGPGGQRQRLASSGGSGPSSPMRPQRPSGGIGPSPAAQSAANAWLSRSTQGA